MDQIEVYKSADVLASSIAQLSKDVMASHEKASLDKLAELIHFFEPCPQLLDKMLDDLIKTLCKSWLSDATNCYYVSDIFYQLSNVRGFKSTSSCLDAGLHNIEPILQRLETSTCWKESWFCLLWLSILVLTPFSLNKINPSLSQNIYNAARSRLKNPGKDREAASVLMGRFLTRPDTEEYLLDFNSHFAQTSIYSKLGMSSSLNYLLKNAPSNMASVLSHVKVCLAELESTSSQVVKMSVKNLGKLFPLVDDFEVMENIIEGLISVIDHKDTIVRFCVARQFVRVCKVLDPELQEQVLEQVLGMLEIEADFDAFSDICLQHDLVNIDLFHGVLIVISELLRNRFVPLCYVRFIISVVSKTIFLEQARLNFSVGSNVRDASCFVIWSLVKKYTTQEIDSSVWRKCFELLMMGSLFDKELVVRRASCAVLQELVGRHGDVLLEPHTKVALIQMMDYVALGSIEKSFALSVQVVRKFDILSDVFCRYYANSGTESSDHLVRTLSADSLAQLIKDQFDALKTSPPSNIESLEASDDSMTGLVHKVDGLLTQFLSQKSIYAASVLIPFCRDGYLERLTSFMSSLTFDFHKDSADLGCDYLCFINSFMKRFEQPECRLVFDIIRLPGERISLHFITYNATLRDFHLMIPPEYEEKYIYYIRHGNLAACRGVGHSGPFMESHIGILLDIVSNEKAHWETRKMLIESFSAHLQHTPMNNLMILVNQLDDYTVTNQGDVGSQIRMHAIRLIMSNISRFGCLKDEINEKLVRLACEPLDKVKHASLELLLILNNWKVEAAPHYDQMLHLYETYLDDKPIALEFWKGFAFSAGGIDSSNVQSFNTFVKHWDESSGALKYLLMILKTSNDTGRSRKMINCALHFWNRILECNLPCPDMFLKTLYIRAYNLQLKQTSIQRLSLTIRIFGNLASRVGGDLRAQVVARLKWIILRHPIKSIRPVAAISLWGFLEGGLHEEFSRIDWYNASEHDLKLVKGIN